MEPTVLKAFISPVINGIFGILKSKVTTTKNELKINIEQHLQEISSWSERVQLYGMSEANLTDDDTIGLLLDIPRKFASSKGNTKTEDFLLSSHFNILLLGDPGSGKTTTIKRVIRRLLIDPPLSGNDVYQYPILIRLRELASKKTICIAIAEKLGIPFEVKSWTIENYILENGVEKKETIIEYFVKDQRLSDVIPELLNKTNAVLLIDGLDEINPTEQQEIETEVSMIANRMIAGKIIMTCRSGGYIHNISGFNLYEICPLEPTQMRSICEIWIENPDIFLNSLQKLPYADLATKPLFLIQLLIIYKNQDELPEKPSRVYKEIIELAIVKWDLQRKIKRKSVYSNFNCYVKKEFLSALSYVLTYQIRSKTFSHELLIEAYKLLYRKFELPINEAEIVTREIESHTGIISEVSGMKFEFSHLSLQEYLCADYISKEPFGNRLPEYLEKYPAPIAVAVSLSSSPENFFALIILRDFNFRRITKNSLIAFLSRMIQEKPMFSESIELGLSFIKLLFYYSEEKSLHKIFDQCFKNEVIRKSVGYALMYYLVDKNKSDLSHYYLIKKSGHLNDMHLETPAKGRLNREIILRFLKENMTRLVTIDEEVDSFELIKNA